MPGFKLWLMLGAAGAAILGVVMIYDAGKKAGQNALLAEQAAETTRRLKNATDAVEADRKCGADAECRMRSDGFKRD